MKHCKSCNEDKPISEFSFKNKSKGTLNSKCRVCRNAYVKTHYKQNKRQYLDRNKRYLPEKIEKTKMMFCEYLSNHKCLHCGESDIRTFEFDHRNPTEKVHNVYTMLSQGVSWKKILLEIDKCDVLCSNCHKKRTNKQFNLYRERYLNKISMAGVSANDESS